MQLHPKVACLEQALTREKDAICPLLKTTEFLKAPLTLRKEVIWLYRICVNSEDRCSVRMKYAARDEWRRKKSEHVRLSYREAELLIFLAFFRGKVERVLEKTHVRSSVRRTVHVRYTQIS